MEEDRSRPPTICIVGVGLMGGSLALAWRRAQFPARIVGVGRRPEPLEEATRRGALDAWTHDLPAAVSESSLVILGAPVGAILSLLPEIGRCATPGTMIMDLGSSKRAICEAMAALPKGLEPIGGHPLCGKETAGFEASDANLFQDRPFVLCPLERTAPATLDRARQLVKASGARPVVLDPEQHDRAVAAISHMPYLLAASAVLAVSEHADQSALLLASSGFRDTTRLASSDLRMMLDTLLTNRDAVMGWLDLELASLAEMRALLQSGDNAKLEARLASARSARAEISDCARW